MNGFIPTLITGSAIVAISAISIPLVAFLYSRRENVETIAQQDAPQIIRTSEFMRGDRVFVPVQYSSNDVYNYVPMKDYLHSLSVLDKDKRKREETRLKLLLETRD